MAYGRGAEGFGGWRFAQVETKKDKVDMRAGLKKVEKKKFTVEDLDKDHGDKVTHAFPPSPLELAAWTRLGLRSVAW